MRYSALTRLFPAAFVATIFLAAADTADAQRYESDQQFKHRMESDIRSVRRRIENVRRELLGSGPDDDHVAGVRRGKGRYPGIAAQLQSLEERCDYQEQYLRRMGPSGMRGRYEVARERRALEDDIRNVKSALGRLKRQVSRLDEETEEAERERQEREALEKEIEDEEW